jgi:hypothetical protein
MIAIRAANCSLSEHFAARRSIRVWRSGLQRRVVATLGRVVAQLVIMLRERGVLLGHAGNQHGGTLGVNDVGTETASPAVGG